MSPSFHLSPLPRPQLTQVLLSRCSNFAELEDELTQSKKQIMVRRGRRNGGREEWRERGVEGERSGGREEWREGGVEGGRSGGREEGREEGIL